MNITSSPHTYSAKLIENAEIEGEKVVENEEKR
jgi:hypothetical protein